MAPWELQMNFANDRIAARHDWTAENKEKMSEISASPEGPDKIFGEFTPTDNSNELHRELLRDLLNY